MPPRSGGSAISEQSLQEGFGRRVVLEADGRSVRKTFHDGTMLERQRLADEEMSRLVRFRAALTQVPGATCPEPLGPVEGAPPGFRMSWIQGEHLMEHLDRRAEYAGRPADIGVTIAAALMAYVEAVGEPYHDLKHDNILVRPSGELAFLDLGLPQDYVPPDPADSPYEASVANLLASLVFESARPKWLLHRRLHRQSALLAEALVAALRDSGATVRGDRLFAAAKRAYLRVTFHRGRPSRTAWYATVGWVAGRGVRLPEGRFRPVPLWEA